MSPLPLLTMTRKKGNDMRKKSMTKKKDTDRETALMMKGRWGKEK